VTDGKRTYRLVRVAADGSLTPRPMLTAGSTGQNLRVTYAPANNGANASVTATVVNALNEAFEHALVRFTMPEPWSYQASAGTIVRQYSEGGFRRVDVNLPIPASGTVATTVSPSGTGTGSYPPPEGPGFVLYRPIPNPAARDARFTFSIPRAGDVRVEIFDLAGARRADLRGTYPAGVWGIGWDLRDAAGVALPTGVYLGRVTFEGTTQTTKLAIVR
jgi:hypothetical protein